MPERVEAVFRRMLLGEFQKGLAALWGGGPFFRPLRHEAQLNEAFHPHLDLQPAEPAVDGLGCPGLAFRIAKQGASGKLQNQSPDDLQGLLGEIEDARPLLPFCRLRPCCGRAHRRKRARPWPT